MQDRDILQLYQNRDRQALVETHQKYGSYCLALASAILCKEQDAQNTVRDAYLKEWQAIPPTRPGSLKIFLAKITRKLAFSRWLGYNAQQQAEGEMEAVLEELESCIPEETVQQNDEDLTATVRDFLNSLPERDRSIFLRRYFFVEESTAIAARYGMQPTAVLRSLSRARKRLETILEQEGYAL